MKENRRRPDSTSLTPLNTNLKDKLRMKEISRLILGSLVLLLTGCSASQKLSQGKAREKIRELGLVQLEGKEVEVEKVVQSGEDQAVAEANLRLVFKLSKRRRRDWQVDAIRLGDRSWMEIRTFLSALDEARTRETRESLQKLLGGLREYKGANGQYPQADSIVKLTDLLVPTYMSEVIRYDGWNREFIFNLTDSNSFQLLSLGPDGIRGTADDIVVGP